MVVFIIGMLAAIAIPNIIGARDRANTQDCIANLNEIESAKELLKVDLRLQDSVTPTQDELVPMYMAFYPTCPANGRYSINAVNVAPTCTVTGHVLPN